MYHKDTDKSRLSASSGDKSAYFLFLLHIFIYTALHIHLTHDWLTFRSRHVQMRPVMPNVWLFNLPAASLRSQVHVCCHICILCFPSTFVSNFNRMEHRYTEFSRVYRCPCVYIFSAMSQRIKNDKCSPLICRYDLLEEEKSPSRVYPHCLLALSTL